MVPLPLHAAARRCALPAAARSLSILRPSRSLRPAAPGALPSCSSSVLQSKRTLVEREPKLGDRLGGPREFREGDGFSDVTVGAELVASQDVLMLFGGGQHDHWQQASALV